MIRGIVRPALLAASGSEQEAGGLEPVAQHQKGWPYMSTAPSTVTAIQYTASPMAPLTANVAPTLADYWTAADLVYADNREGKGSDLAPPTSRGLTLLLDSGAVNSKWLSAHATHWAAVGRTRVVAPASPMRASPLETQTAGPYKTLVHPE